MSRSERLLYIVTLIGVMFLFYQYLMKKNPPPIYYLPAKEVAISPTLENYQVNKDLHNLLYAPIEERIKNSHQKVLGEISNKTTKGPSKS